MQADAIETLELEEVTAEEGSAHDRILVAAFAAFIERGFAETSTLEIATKARVSKRELYALFGSKQAMLVACIAYRIKRMKNYPDLPAPQTRLALKTLLTVVGATVLRESCRSSVVALHRLAIAELDRSPEVARTLTAAGRISLRKMLADLIARAQSAGLIEAGDPVPMAQDYMALLLGTIVLGLMLREIDPPDQATIENHARATAEAFLRIHPAPSGRG